MLDLTNLRNKHRSFQRKMKSAKLLDAEEEERFNEATAFVELVEYIEDSVENGTLFFPLPELHSLFENRLSDLGYPKSVNQLIDLGLRIKFWITSRKRTNKTMESKPC